MNVRSLIPVAALAVIAAAGTAATAGAAPGRPDLEVRTVADPVPTGEAGGYGLRLEATVTNTGSAGARSSDLRFYLSSNRRLGEADTRLPAVAVDGLAPGGADAVTQSWTLPDRLDAGIYHVIACADAGRDVAERDESNNCAVADETVAVTEPGGDTDAQAGAPMPGAAAPATSPKKEWFPESYLVLFASPVSDAFDCPASTHGQGTGRCVWVKTQKFRSEEGKEEEGRRRSDFWYCPTTHPFPFEVAAGFDPMWRFIGFRSDAFVETVAHKKWTLYRNWLGREYYPSFGGPDDTRGYVSIDFNGAGHWIFANPWEHQAEFLCSTKRANSMLP
jgi:hypothetical protein